MVDSEGHSPYASTPSEKKFTCVALESFREIDTSVRSERIIPSVLGVPEILGELLLELPLSQVEGFTLRFWRARSLGTHP